MCIFKHGHGRRFTLRTTEKHTQLVVRAGITGLRVRRADYSATLPPHATIPELQQE